MKKLHEQKSIINDEVYHNVKKRPAKMEHPDPKLHQTVSFLKSAVRISGYVALFWSIGLAAIILIISELIGIVEELV